MNMMHVRYIVEVAKTGSVSKASENMMIAQPNLSRAIKDLETELGIVIFKRTVKGMSLTEEGERFVAYGRNVLKQIDELEDIYKGKNDNVLKFSVACPRASYISEAFANFSAHLQSEEMEIFYHETGSQKAIEYVKEGNYKLGIVRYRERFKSFFDSLFEEQGLNYEPICTFNYVIVTSAKSKLARLDDISFNQLNDYIEVEHANPSAKYLPYSKDSREGRPENSKKIYVFERASQYEILSKNPTTFMWNSPVPENILHRYNLVQIPSKQYRYTYCDVLIYQKGYQLTEYDKKFVRELKSVTNK